MTTARIVLTGFIVAVVCGGAALAAYQPVEGKIMTRWAKEVSPTNALPEYPRPQMVRKEWKNLNGLWDYAIRTKDQVRPESFDGQILVPYPVESALSGVKKTVTPNDKLWYRLSFEVPGNWPKGKLLLHFGAVDFQAEVWVNGTKLGDHAGGYDPFSFDISNAVKSSGPQELIVAVTDPTDRGTQPRGKQVLKPGGIMYTAVTGIWQTVWIEPVPSAYIRGLTITPDIDNNKLTVVVDAQGDTSGLSFTADAKSSGYSASASFSNNPLTLTVNNPKLWSPDSPFLYDLTVRLTDKGKTIDSVQSYFGMRKIAIGKDEQGIQRLMLNNKPLFQYGPLDQGWWPDGLYTAPTDAALKYDLEVLKKIGCNMLRKHVKVEPDRLYYWCDKLGLLVWQDMPSGDRGIRSNDPDLQRSPESAKQYELELARMIDAFRNHPSIIMWVPFNEGWGQYDTPRIVQLVRDLDPSRLVNNASGWTDRKVGDVSDMHNYPGPGMPAVEDKRAAVLGEFGGLGLPLKGHTWQDAQNWGYQSFQNREELTDAYAALMSRLHMLIPKGLCAAVYTQTTDVEVEVNGWMTYDREVLKIDAEKITAAHRRLYQPAPQMRELIPTSQKQAAAWKFTTDKPADGWEQPGFDAAGWKEGPAGFGTESTPGSVVRTVWNTPDIWLRRSIELAAKPAGSLCLMIHHDEDAEVYINGVLAVSLKGFTSEYSIEPISSKAQQGLKAGPNTFAVHCKQTGGGQYIDLGLVEVVEAVK
jgi:beta-galactosidase/beta-glucuronidase